MVTMTRRELLATTGGVVALPLLGSSCSARRIIKPPSGQVASAWASSSTVDGGQKWS